MTERTYNENTYTVEGSEHGLRLDVFLSERMGCSRSHVKFLFEKGLITTSEGNPSKVGEKVKVGQSIIVRETEPEALSLEPENIPLDIVYEDEHLAVINKQAGLVVHPAQGSERGTLVNALLFHLDNLSGINGVIRPGIVHRLDKDTTGLLVVAKNDNAHVSLAEQIAQKTCRRVYWAIVDGNPSASGGVIDQPIDRHPKDRKKMAVVRDGGRRAVTHWRVLKRYTNCALLEFVLETGRTHQIRVHARFMGYPVSGDPLYGTEDKFNADRQLLHAKELSFTHPVTGEEMTFHAELPEDFKAIMAKLKEKS